MSTKKEPKKLAQLPRFDDAQAELLRASISKLTELPDAPLGAVATDDKFSQIIKDSFRILYDALTVKGLTKDQLISNWRRDGINASMFKFNKTFNALVAEHKMETISEYKKRVAKLPYTDTNAAIKNANADNTDTSSNTDTKPANTETAAPVVNESKETAAQPAVVNRPMGMTAGAIKSRSKDV